MSHRAATIRCALLAALPLLLAACQGVDYTPNDRPVSEADRARYVKRRVEDALAFRVQQRFEAAEHQLRLALSGSPDHARAHALLARTLEDLGRPEEAARHAARARQLAPGPAPPDDAPLVPDASGVLVVVLAPREPAPPAAERAGAADATDGSDGAAVARQALAARARARLPKAFVIEALPESLSEAETLLREHAQRGVISLRIDGRRCAESVKDGPFALASLTVVTALPGALPDEPAYVRASDDDPPRAPGCARVALARAFDEALELPGTARVLAARPASPQGAWSALAARALLPLREAQVAGEIARGRAQARAGETEIDAARVIENAERERASDRAERTDRNREAPQNEVGHRDPETLALEAEVAAERRRRDELLATLRVDELARRAPLPEEIAVLRRVEAREPEGIGLLLARDRAGGRPVEARVLVAPDGRRLARFYFEAGAEARTGEATPLLREEDTDEDGIPDRWTAYTDGRPGEVWEDRGASGHPNAHILLAPDGVSTQTIEIDMDRNGRPERVFHYEAGRLVAGDADTNGDGILDRFERFDDAGELVSREEDLDADGRIDVRSEFTAGRLVRREIRAPALLETHAAPSPDAK
ncbi:MAG: hypothetical protein IT386_10930 [Deltaproteobacteria bacterium]|nr:hypothetical protein [Deltaproteobacteria bacterium]